MNKRKIVSLSEVTTSTLVKVSFSDCHVRDFTNVSPTIKLFSSLCRLDLHGHLYPRDSLEE